MKKLTALVVLLTVIGTTSFASSGPLGENSTFKVVNKADAKYELVYISSDESDVRVTIFDEEGRNIETNTIKDVAKFRRTFDFSQMEHGKYSIVVKNDKGTGREEIAYFEKQMKLKSFVAKIPESRSLKLHVGDFNMDKPVYVKIFDQDKRIIHRDVINKAAAFSRIYRIDKAEAGEVTVEIENDDEFKSFTYPVYE